MAADAVVQALTRMISDKAFHDQVAKDPKQALQGLGLDDHEVQLLGGAATDDIDHIFTGTQHTPKAKALIDYVTQNKKAITPVAQAGLNKCVAGKFANVVGRAGYVPLC